MRGGGITRQKTPNPIRLLETLDPSATPDTGYTYTNDVAGRTELMYMDDTGAEIQITKTGALNVGAGVGSTLTLSGAATTLDLTNTTSFGGGSVRLGSAQSIIYDAANSTGLRNGANPQTFGVYNTFTAGTPDYERLELTWSSNIAFLRTAKNGTGTARTLDFMASGSTNTLLRIPTALTSGVDLSLVNLVTAVSTGAVAIGRTGSLTATSGTNVELNFSRTFSDGGTNSTTVAQGLALTNTVNYTGASKTGKVVLAYFAPTLTSQPTGANAGVSFSSALNSTTFPATIWNNVADEDTNYERMEASWGVALTNSFCFRVTKGGSGTLRTISFLFAGTSTQALVIPNAVGNTMDFYTGSAGGTVNSAGYVRFGGATGAGTCTATSGTSVGANFTFSPAPTATSTMAYSVVQINPTINYSNGTPGAGYVQCLRIAPINTALPTGLSCGIALASTASALAGGILWHNQTDEVTNVEYVYEKFTSNVWEIGSVKLGSGTLRGLRFGITGNSIGFYGVTPVARPGAYTLTATVVASRTLLANASATVANCNSVIAQMIQDLQAVGLFQ